MDRIENLAAEAATLLLSVLNDDLMDDGTAETELVSVANPNFEERWDVAYGGVVLGSVMRSMSETVWTAWIPLHAGNGGGTMLGEFASRDEAARELVVYITLR